MPITRHTRAIDPAPRHDDTAEVPARLVLAAEEFDRVIERIERAEPPTPAMRALFAK